MVSPRLHECHEDICKEVHDLQPGILRRTSQEIAEACARFSTQRDRLRKLGHHDEADVLQMTVKSLEYKLKVLRHEIADLEAHL